jgi:DNA-binding transcriptional LysR family regulator
MSIMLNGIYAFVEAVQAGNFALAAEKMHISRSAVGKSIARLEEQLGTRLFHRTTRRQSLTDAGQVFYERCMRALAELESAKSEVDQGRHELIGKLRISVPVLFGRKCIAPILLALLQRHFQLELDVSFSDRRVELIDDHIDLAIRVGDLEDSTELVSRRLGLETMVVCASPVYLAQNPAPNNLDELSAHQGVVYGRAGRVNPWKFLDAQGVVQEKRIASRIRFDDLQAIADTAIAGAGLAWLPRWLIAEQLSNGMLIPVLDRESSFGFDISAVWAKTSHMPSKLRLVVDELITQVPAILGAVSSHLNENENPDSKRTRSQACRPVTE